MLAPGTKLGPYEITGPLGVGGMGEVYRARDARLGRDVAVKVLPAAASPELRLRFEREAHAVASLNHPHICTLHDVGREGDTDFLVMELLGGETLAARLERGPLPTGLLLRTGIEIADALDRAHRSGIVHRDLKPGNIMMTKGGAKLMDFGLARGRGPAAGPIVAAVSQTPTVTQPLTAEGTIVGTFQYMSPEQLEGKEADGRSDLWALGCVLYEMATGRRAFEGRSQASLISAIMSSEPPAIATLAPMSPPALDRLVRACIAKSADDRIQAAHDVKLQLQWIRDADSLAGAPVPVVERRRHRERLAWIVAGATTLGLVVGAVLVVPRISDRLDPQALARFSVTSPEGVTMVGNVAVSAISPDGRKLAYLAADSSGTTRIWIRPIETLAAQPLVGTDDASCPFWSPDSRELGFFADGKLRRIALSGAPAEVLCDAPDGRGGTWSRDGTILFAPVAAGSIYRVSARGGEPVEIMRPDSSRQETGLRWPQFLPDGKHYLFTSMSQRLEDHDVCVAALGSGNRKRLFAASAAPVYAEPGYLVFVRNGRLVAQRFDPRRLDPSGETQPLGEAPPSSFVQGAPAATVSTTGILAYPGIGRPRTQLAWFDRAGKPLSTIPMPASDWWGAALSPDGRHIVVVGQGDLWMVEPSRGVTSRFTFGRSARNAVWSPDGRWVAYNAGQDIWRKPASGPGEEALLYHSSVITNIWAWSPDGRYLVFTAPDATTGWDVWLLPVEGDRKPIPYLRSRFNELGGWTSPDGRWIAYICDESGRREIYVQSFPTPGNKHQITSSGAFGGSTWSKDGSEMLLGAPGGVLQVAKVQTTPTIQVGVPHTLFKLRPDVEELRPMPDFSRFLVTLSAGATPASSITLELNWVSELRRR